VADVRALIGQAVVYRLPKMDQVTVFKNITYESVDGLDLQLDVYHPPAASPGFPPPVVLLIPGPAPQDLMQHIKDSAVFVSWAQLIACSGMAAIACWHRAPIVEHPEAAADVDALISYVHTHREALNIDGERIGVFAFSGAPPYALRSALRDSPRFIHAVAAYYGVMDLQQSRSAFPAEISDEYLQEFSAVHYLGLNPTRLPPILVVKAGQDKPWLNRSIDNFVASALEHNVTLELMTHPKGRHGFDTADDDERSRQIIRRTLRFFSEQLED